MTDSRLTSSALWGYSFVAVSVGVSSVLVAPLAFSLFSKKKLQARLPALACFGSGAILALVFNHNLVDVIETVSYTWKLGSVFLAGVLTNYVGIFGFTTDAHCCELEPDESSGGGKNNKCCTTGIRSAESEEAVPPTPNKHSIKHWIVPVAVGDSLCNFSDGILISSAFVLCGHALGWSTTLAVVLHEVTHEIGDFAIMLSSGMTLRRALVVNLLCSTTSYLGWIIVNSLNSLHAARLLSAYLVAFGSGVLVALVLTLLPRYIKNTSLRTQRIRLGITLLGGGLSTLLLTTSKHCE